MKISLQDKSDWITALKSGKYKQGKGVLNREDKEFCCLGVLCELQMKPEMLEKIKHNEFNFSYSKAWTNLPSALLNKFHTSNRDSIIKELISMNDGDSGFNEIAEYIELNVEVI